MVNTPITRPSLGLANWMGVKTLYVKEIHRFFKIFSQTLIAAVITTLFFLAVFSVIFGSNRMVDGIPYVVFLGPGLIMMTILQTSFANTSTSLIQQKLNESIVDVLMPPLSPLELSIGYILGGATRGVFVAISVGLTLFLIIPIGVHSVIFVIIFGLGAASMMSAIGMIAGIWAEKFDHVSTVTNFIMLPLSFLSGTFFSVERFPDILRTISYFNPFFYLIDGFRYGFTGYSDGSLLVGLAVIVVSNILLWLACYFLLQNGYKLKT